jgi:hypothetical protein
MQLIWKVGNTYHLCGDGFETSIHTAIAGESFRLFLPVFDSREGFRFMNQAVPQVETPERMRESADEGKIPSRRPEECRSLEEWEPTEN